MSSVDASVLDDLLEAVDDADHRLLVSNVDQRFTDLESTVAELDGLLASYASQLAGIHYDIDNIRQINETLPRECFKEIDLEPVEPEPPVYE